MGIAARKRLATKKAEKPVVAVAKPIVEKPDELAGMKAELAAIISRLSAEDCQFLAHPVYKTERVEEGGLVSMGKTYGGVEIFGAASSKKYFASFESPDGEWLGPKAGTTSEQNVRTIAVQLYRDVSTIDWPIYSDSIVYEHGGREVVMSRSSAMRRAFMLKFLIAEEQYWRDARAQYWPNFPDAEGELAPGAPARVRNAFRAAKAKAEDAEMLQQSFARSAASPKTMAHVLSRETVDAVYAAMAGKTSPEEVTWPSLANPFPEVRVSGEEYRRNAPGRAGERQLAVAQDMSAKDRPAKIRVSPPKGVQFMPDYRLRNNLARHGYGLAPEAFAAIVSRRSKGTP